METRTSFSSGYQSQHSGAASYPTDSQGLSSVRLAPPTSTDSISLGRQLRSIKEKPTGRNLSKLGLFLRVLGVTKIVSWTICGTSLFAVGILLITPLLLPLITLGGCFAEGLIGWLEFTGTALSMSLTPAILAAVTAASGFAAGRYSRRLSQGFEQQQRETQELRALKDLIIPKETQKPSPVLS